MYSGLCVFFNLLEKIFLYIYFYIFFWKYKCIHVAVINIIDWSSYRRQSIGAGPANSFHSLHFPLLLFRLQSAQQCVCVYAPSAASVVRPDTQRGFFPFHEFLVGATYEVAPICLWRITDGAYLAEMFTVGHLQHLASMLPPPGSRARCDSSLWASSGPGVVLARVFMLLGVMLDARHRHPIQTTAAALPASPPLVNH